MDIGDAHTSGRATATGRGGRSRTSVGAIPQTVVIPPVDNTPDAGTLAGVPAGAGVKAPIGVAATALHGAQDGVEDLANLGDASGQLSDAQLDDAVRAHLATRAEAERALVLHLADAMQRGIIDTSDRAGARQWLTARSDATIEPFEVTRVIWAAEAINRVENAGLRRLFLNREVTAAQLATVVREAPKALACLPDVDRDQILGYYVYAAQRDCSRRELRELTRRIVQDHGGDRGAAEEEKAQAAESLVWHDLPGGLVELIAILSPGHAQQVKAAIQALATPKPPKPNDGHSDGDDESGPDPTTDTGRAAPSTAASAGHRADRDAKAPTPAQRDARSPGKRRVDALMELVGAAARVDERDAARATAKVVVTMGLETLLERLDGAGYAVTEADRSIDAGTARRLACNANLIPAVLGSDGAPMDVGRVERTFTGSLRAAIVLRDRHCTFPGCDRPPSWCEGHHIIPWWAGGDTAKTNGTLLCSRHHHVVHSRGYLATVTESGVEWDLTPGRMQQLSAAG